jgi:hypothetical protein
MPARTAHTSAAACFAAALAAPAALAQVPNDACSSPTPLSGYQSVDFSTAGATSDALGDSGCTLIYNDVWFCWTATATDTVEMATCTTPRGTPSWRSMPAVAAPRPMLR